LALTGDSRPLASRRGTIETGLHGGPVLLTWHPSHILRMPDRAGQTRLRHELEADLAAGRRHVAAAARQSTALLTAD
jgi:DNA polymerase